MKRWVAILTEIVTVVVLGGCANGHADEGRAHDELEAPAATSSSACTTDADCGAGRICTPVNECMTGTRHDGLSSDDDATGFDDVTSNDDAVASGDDNDDDNTAPPDPSGLIRDGCDGCTSTVGAFCTTDNKCVLPGAPFKPYPIELGSETKDVPVPDEWPYNDPAAVVLSMDNVRSPYYDIHDGMVAWIQQYTRPGGGLFEMSSIHQYDVKTGTTVAFPSRDGKTPLLQVAVADTSTLGILQDEDPVGAKLTANSWNDSSGGFVFLASAEAGAELTSNCV